MGEGATDKLEPGDALRLRDRRTSRRGRNGRGLRARDTKLNRDVALKILQRRSHRIPESRASSARRSCSPCSMIPTLERSTAWEKLKASGLVLELVEGPTLATGSRGPIRSRKRCLCEADGRRARAGHELGSSIAI